MEPFHRTHIIEENIVLEQAPAKSKYSDRYTSFHGFYIMPGKSISLG